MNSMRNIKGAVDDRLYKDKRDGVFMVYPMGRRQNKFRRNKLRRSRETCRSGGRRKRHEVHYFFLGIRQRRKLQNIRAIASIVGMIAILYMAAVIEATDVAQKIRLSERMPELAAGITAAVVAISVAAMAEYIENNRKK